MRWTHSTEHLNFNTREVVEYYLRRAVEINSQGEKYEVKYGKPLFSIQEVMEK
jgi:hypothetical protein